MVILGWKSVLTLGTGETGRSSVARLYSSKIGLFCRFWLRIIMGYRLSLNPIAEDLLAIANLTGITNWGVLICPLGFEMFHF